MKKIDETFSNFGFEAIAVDDDKSDYKTIIIIGVPRSGTSMVASVVKEMGIFIGNSIDNAVFEDHDIAQTIISGENGNIKNLINDRNNNYDSWGFKRPDAYKHLSNKMKLFRNPMIISTFRDPVAIAKRNQVSMYSEFYSSLNSAIEETKILSTFLSQQKCPRLFVSYEKALFNPSIFVSTLAQFIGIELPESDMDKIAGSIENGPEVYRQSSRLKFEGKVDQLNKNGVSGWVYQIGNKNPKRVDIFCRGEKIASGLANNYRKDLDIAKKLDGKCAFTIPLDLRNDDLNDIEIFVENTQYSISHSSGLRSISGSDERRMQA